MSPFWFMSLQTFQYEFIWIFIIRTNIFVKSHELLLFGCSPHLPQSTICFHLSLTLTNFLSSFANHIFFSDWRTKIFHIFPKADKLRLDLNRYCCSSYRLENHWPAWPCSTFNPLWSIPVWHFWTVKMDFLILCLLTGCWYDKPNSARRNLTLHHSRVKYPSHLEQKLSQNCQRSQSACMWSSVPKGDMTARGPGVGVGGSGETNNLLECRGLICNCVPQLLVTEPGFQFFVFRVQYKNHMWHESRRLLISRKKRGQVVRTAMSQCFISSQGPAALS